MFRPGFCAETTLNLPDLQALLWISRAGSLQAAAHASGVARTTLRHRLERLRAAVGDPLVAIGSQGASLTPAGELLVQRAPSLLSKREALQRDAQRVAAEPSGLLRVLLGSGFPPMLVARVVASASLAAPDLRLDLHHDARPLERLDEGFDVVVHWGAPPPPRDGYSRVIIRLPERLMAAPEYLERQGTPKSLEDLSTHSLLSPSGDQPSWPLLAGGAFPFQPTHTADDLYLLGALAGMGAGIALLPSRGVEIHSSMEALVPVLKDLVGGEQVVRVFMPTPTFAGGAPHSMLEKLRSLLEATGSGER